MKSEEVIFVMTGFFLIALATFVFRVCKGGSIQIELLKNFE